jgi:Zn-dependent M32 family carboxypeptidase
MGYFPTYTMGSMLAAQFAAQIFKESNSMAHLIPKAKAHFEQKVFCHGALLRSQELLPKSPKEIVDCFLSYVDTKYQDYL